ncbi:MAG: tetratricopeptide repeat protein, partial [Planctomycetota bacterium]|nr:tetratricopeptide repeat protein [Planctomycetota bacterium]
RPLTRAREGVASTGIGDRIGSLNRREEIAYLRAAAFDGQREAQYDLACAYAEGNGVPKNQRTAFRWFEKAADSGDGEAMTAVGYCYLNGEGADLDEDAAVKWLRRAKEAGSSDADRYLTGCMIYGQGMPQDLDLGVAKAEQLFDATQDAEYAYLLACAYSDLREDDAGAREWHTKAATLGHDESMVWMGYYCRFGIGMPRNLKHAFQWYKRAADAGNDAGMENLAVCYQHGEGVPQDLERAYDCRSQAASMGHPVSKRWLGKHLIHGAGVEPDPEKGIALLQELADTDGTACMMLGELYYYGEGIDSDLTQAVRWFEKAAEAQVPEAWTFLGTMAWHGEGQDKDAARAERLYRLAAEAGESQAVFNLSYLFDERGESAKALTSLEQAASMGHGGAACQLAKRSITGVGMPKNVERAMDYLEPAVAEEDPDALYMKAELLREGVGTAVDLRGALELFQLAQIQGRDTRVERGVLRRRMRGLS